MSTSAAEIWGSHAAATYMHAAFFKGEERVVTEVRSDGALGGLVVECIPVGETRGSVSSPHASGTVEELLGNGSMVVRKILYNAARPYETHVRSSPHVAQDWMDYYENSEQTPTLVLLESRLEGGSPFVGGITVQALPGAEGAATIFTLQARAANGEIAPVSELYQPNGLMGVVGAIFDVPEAQLGKLEDNAEYRWVDYFCRCSKAGYLDRLATLPPDDISSLAQEGGTELTCHYCNEGHTVTPEELRSLLKR